MGALLDTLGDTGLEEVIMETTQNADIWRECCVSTVHAVHISVRSTACKDGAGHVFFSGMMLVSSAATKEELQAVYIYFMYSVTFCEM